MLHCRWMVGATLFASLMCLCCADDEPGRSSVPVDSGAPPGLGQAAPSPSAIDEVIADDATEDAIGPDAGNSAGEHAEPGADASKAIDAATERVDASRSADGGPLPTHDAAIDDASLTSTPNLNEAGPGDAGAACPPFVMPAECSVPEGAVLPGDLYCTGLYPNWPSRELGCGIVEYAPAYSLWSDGSEKTRHVWIPPGETIDVSDPDDFRYPVGTQFWKEFRVPDGETMRLGETRLMRRVAAGWLYTSYVWSEDEAEAVQENFGVFDLHGTGHTVPSREQCKACHSGRPDFILGWDAVMLGEGATGVTRDDLLVHDWVTWEGVTEAVPNPLELSVPGDQVERRALGYLHANCGVSCHNDTTAALALETGFFMRLDAGQLASVQDTPTFATGFERPPNPNAPLTTLAPPADGGTYVDLRPLDTARSLVLLRMQVRGSDIAMPRLGTHRVDEEGVLSVREWIEHMTPDLGYPVPGTID